MLARAFNNTYNARRHVLAEVGVHHYVGLSAIGPPIAINLAK